MELEVLEALVTYMYHGTVSVPQHRLQSFLKTAEALKIKGIVDTSSSQSSSSVTMPSSPRSLPTAASTLAQTHVTLSQTVQEHPAGDLSLLATAASEPCAQLEPPTSTVSSVTPQAGVKRRKTAPRKLGSYVVTNAGHLPRAPYSPSHHVEEEEEDREKENQILASLTWGNRENIHNQVKLIHPVNLSKCQDSSSAPTPFSPPVGEDTSLDLSLPRPSPPASSTSSPPASPPTSHLSLLSSFHQPTSTPSPLNILHMDGVSSADQMAALLGPEQMAALLGPSWKSRQPRMCQYCQRMFSNKFNLKQHILNMHTVGRELACEICQKKVKNKWYLRRHHVTHHGAPLKK